MKKFADTFKSFLIWFCIFYLSFWAAGQFFGDNKKTTTEGIVTLKPIDDDVVMGVLAQFQLKNDTTEAISVASACGAPEQMQVSRLVNGEKFNLSDKIFADCGDKTLAGITLEPGTRQVFDVKDFSGALFTEPGKYVLDLQYQLGEETQKVSTDIFAYEKPGIFRTLFRAIVTKPLFNGLVFFVEKLPGHSLGWAIVLLTLVVRIILFMPNQKAMRSQRKLQKLQPKIEALKKKHGNNQQMMAMKTMELYKSEKINPMSSCLPLLLQMPFLIGVYFVVKDGLSEHMRPLLYSFHQEANLSLVDPYFFGLDLGVPNIIVLPLLVGLAQFAALKLSFSAAAKKKDPNAKPAEGFAGQAEQMQKMMLYVLPVMIAIFTATFAAAVGIYWLTSTVFGVFQQKLVNYQLDKHPEVRRKN